MSLLKNFDWISSDSRSDVVNRACSTDLSVVSMGVIFSGTNAAVTRRLGVFSCYVFYRAATSICILQPFRVWTYTRETLSLILGDSINTPRLVQAIVLTHPFSANDQMSSGAP